LDGRRQSPAPPRRLAALFRARRINRVGKVRESVDLVGDRHRGDEMTLEARLDCGFDLLHAARPPRFRRAPRA
jgi:hypothetical protein